MLHLNELKKSNKSNIRYSIDQQPIDKQKKVGKKLTKQKNELKIKKHYSQLQDFSIEGKQNNSVNNINSYNRAQSSLMCCDQIQKRKKKHLSMESICKQRDSLLSKLSGRRRKSRNSHSFQQQHSGFKNKLGELRRKCNLSCNDMIDQRQTKSQKKLKNQKRHSINTLVPTYIKIKKQKSPEVKIKHKKVDFNTKKSISSGLTKDKPNKKKSSVNLINPKKKSSKNLIKKQKQKQKKFIVSKDVSILQEEYPIQKYISMGKQSEIKSKKQRKVIDTSRQHSYRGAHHPLVQIDYASCLNIFSASSGVLRSSDLSLREAMPQLHGPLMKQVKLPVSGDSSLNLSEIRFYQKHSPYKQKNQRTKQNTEFKSSNKSLRQNIAHQIFDEYPGLNQEELIFLSSVILIQRKWRQRSFYLNLFKFRKPILIQEKSACLNMKDTRTHSITINRNFTTQSKQQILQQGVSRCEVGIQVKQQDQLIIEDNRIIQKQKQEIKKLQLPAYEQQQIIEMQRKIQSDRTPKQKYSDINYYSLEKDIYPPLSYLTIRSSIIKSEVQKSIYQLNALLTTNKITKEQYIDKKKQFQNQYRLSMTEIKKFKHDIKKGYLKYIDCYNKTRGFQKSGLRKVSSQSGFISVLYQKIFKLDIGSESQDSQSIKKLSHRFLIRKQFLNNKFQKNIETISNLHNSEIFSERYDEINEFNLSKQICQLKQNEVINISDFLMKSQKAKQEPIDIQIKEQENSQFLEFQPVDNIIINKHFNNNQKLETQIENLVINELTVELQEDLLQFNTLSIEQVQPKSISSKANIDQKFQVVKLSPLSSNRSYDQEDMEVLQYLSKFIEFLESQNHLEQLILKMNQDQGFSPVAYLKFLRDFQLPDEQYQTLIKNDVFVQWENYYLNITQTENFMKQSKTILHRCIFQAFISELQKKRKYGDKGKPFPWQSLRHQYHQVYYSNIPKIFADVFQNISRICSFRCGIIDSKHIYFTEQQLQKIHEDNEDQIIHMLQNELVNDSHAWYQLDEHILEVKLQVSFLIEQELINEIFTYLMLQ